MFKGTKCGCPYCKKQEIPSGKWGWKSRTNKHGRKIGKFSKSK